jgi:hypothetical protein
MLRPAETALMKFKRVLLLRGRVRIRRRQVIVNNARAHFLSWYGPLILHIF